MTVYVPPLADIRFAMRAVGGLDEITRLPGLAHAAPDVVDAVLEEAGRFAAEVIAPLNPVGDREGVVLENGIVRTATGFKEAYARFADGGWMGVTAPAAHGGQDLPHLIGTACAELWNAANLSLYLCPLLTQSAIEALLQHGSDEQKRDYLDKLIAGTWTGAMCLTEPQAGTDLGAVRTRAVPEGDRYRIFGQKIYITFGDHDMAENVVHLVLARLPEAPAGTRGISLFIVPKFLPGPDGGPGPRNDWRCLKLEHKLGIHGSPTCVISYGDDVGAVGFLVGEPHAGMRCMFTMMNNARLAVGHEGLGLAERAFQQALAYARERGQPSPIVNFPDVRRTLLSMRAQIAAMRALCLWTASFVDRAARTGDAAAAGRVALLTPIVKAWCTDLAHEITRDAVQVHGGMGFIEETGAAQHYRDAKILSIYEGTNGIQAMDLVGRKLTMAEGRLPWDLLDELHGDVDRAPADLRDGLAKALATAGSTTRFLQAADPEIRGAAAASYLRLLATTIGACLLVRGSGAATDDDGADWPGLARLFVRHLLPPAVAAGAAATAAGDFDAGLLPKA